MTLIECEVIRAESIEPMELTEQKAERGSTSGVVLPADIGEWVAVPMVRKWVMDEAASLNWEHPEIQEYLRKNPNFQPKGLLCLLTFAYAVGTFESEEIVARCFREPTLRSFVDGSIPTVAELGKFRKLNRGLIKWALARVFKRAVREHYGLGELIPAGIRRAIVDSATERLELARHMDRAAQGA